MSVDAFRGDVVIIVRAVPDGDGPTVRVQTAPDAAPASGEVAIAVTAAGVNRADVLQSQGRYTVPAGASDVLGLEVSGTVVQCGAGVSETWLGEPVVALLTSGGYATRAVADIRTVVKAPRGLDAVAAAGIIEVAATVVSNLVMVAGFRAGDTVMIHGATGGVSQFAIQLIHALGGIVAVTASTTDKLRRARALGADILINYRTEQFDAVMAQHGGADIILDSVGGAYLEANVRALRRGGRIITIGMQGGREATLDLGLLMTKKASITGTLLRDRPPEDKAAILERTYALTWPLIESGTIDVQPHRTFPLRDAAAALDYVASRQHTGKVVLTCTDLEAAFATSGRWS